MKRLLLVGWDAADWKVIDPLLERGEMPHLAKLIREGVRGNLATISPPLSPMVWTSIATGKRPHKHGIHGFTEPAQDGLSVRPVSNLGRTAKAFWNILNQHGLRSIVAGWWPSHPAEPIRGAMVSNLFPFATSDDPAGPMPPGAVWPPSLTRRMEELRVHGVEVHGDLLRLFVPDFDKIDQRRDKSLHDLAGIVAETMSIHAAATDLIENEPWDMAAVYYTGIDHFSHRFMRFHVGKIPNDGAGPDPALYAGIVANAYRYHDVMLGRLVALAGPECAVMVLSDHGFHSDRLLPDYIPAEAAGPAVEHRPFGILCMRAPGVAPGGRVFGAGVLDIAPTVLHLFGIPAARDMDGKVLINAFRNRSLPDPVASWDEVPGDDGRHPLSRQYDGVASAEALKQLVALGYIAPLGAEARNAVESCVTENRYNLARAWSDAGRPDESAAILRALVATDPTQARFHRELFFCQMRLGDPAAAEKVLDAYDRACAEFAPKAERDLAERRAERPDTALPANRDGPGRRETFERRELAEKAGGFAVDRKFLRCRLEIGRAKTRKRKNEALRLLEELAAGAGHALEPALFLAQGFAAMGEGDRALEYVRRARHADRENWQAMALEAGIHQAAGRHDRAVACALESLSLIYFQPSLHYRMGVSLAKSGDRVHAEQSFRVALSQATGLAPAHDELARLIRTDRTRLGEAGLHMARAKLLREEEEEETRRRTRPEPVAIELDTDAGTTPPVLERWDGSPPADRSRAVWIVTGLPRSGTSMTMQMLAAAGLEPYTDRKRVADEDNPRGYFEHEQAARLHEDSSWIPTARGKVVKIVPQLLPWLPPGEEYRVVFMWRDLEEVVASQKAMLARAGRAGAELDDGKLMRAYRTQLLDIQERLHRIPGCQVVAVNYSEVLADPGRTVSLLARFLGEPFDRGHALESVDGGLRRQFREPAAGNKYRKICLTGEGKTGVFGVTMKERLQRPEPDPIEAHAG